MDRINYTVLKGLLLTAFMLSTIFSTLAGPSGKAVFFGACPDSYLEAPGFPMPSGDQLTVATWVKWTDKDEALSAGNATLAAFSNPTGNGNEGMFWLQHTPNNDHFEFVVKTDQGSASVQSVTSPQAGVWYHVAGVYNGEDLRLYINGYQEAIQPLAGYLQPGLLDAVLSFGRWPNADLNYRHFYGGMDEMNVWNRALTRNQVMLLRSYPLNMVMDSYTTYQAEGLLGFWNFDLQIDSLYNLTGTNQPEILGNGTAVDYLHPHNSVSFSVTNIDNTPYHGNIRIGSQLYALINGQTELIVPPGTHYYFVETAEGQVVASGKTGLVCGTAHFNIKLADASLLYFSTGDGIANSLLQWSDKPDGSGNHPLSFNSGHARFIIREEHQMEINENWNVKGLVHLESGAVFNTSGDFILNATFSMAYGATFVVNSKTSSVSGIVFQDLDARSTLWVRSPVLLGQENLSAGNLLIDLPTTVNQITIAASMEVNDLSVLQGGIFIEDADLMVLGDINWESTAGIFSTDGASLTICGYSQMASLPGGRLGALTMNREKGVELTGRLSLKNLQMNLGNLTAGANGLLLLEPGGKFHNFSCRSYVQAPVSFYLNEPNVVQSNTRVIPLGTSTCFRPVTLEIDHVRPGAVEYRIELVEGLAPNLQLPDDLMAISRNCYVSLKTITKDNLIAGGTISLRYNFQDGVVDASLLRIAKADGDRWVNLGGQGTDDFEGVITSSQRFESDGIFALANFFGLNEAMPVDLLSFTASADENHNRIQWQTASEINNRGFWLEKSADGMNYSSVAFIDGAGTVSHTLDYQFDDFDVLNDAATVYYRLVQEDYDGESTIYGPVPLSRNAQNEKFQVIFSRVSGSRMLVRVFAEVPFQGSVGVVGIDGRTVLGVPLTAYAGENQLMLDMSSAPKGANVLWVEHGQERQSFRFFWQ
jgi:hypothetical protein